MNIDLHDKYGERITYAVLPSSFIWGDDLEIGKCLFVLDKKDNKYKTQTDALCMLDTASKV